VNWLCEWLLAAVAVATFSSAACAHPEPLLLGLRTQAVLGMGNGTGPGVPTQVLRALATPGMQQLLRRPATPPPAEPSEPSEPSAAESVPEPAGKELPSVLAKIDLRGKHKERLGYPLAARGGYKISFYWVAWESQYANEPYDVDIYNRHGFRIGRFPRAYVFELKMEGSGILRDGRVINHDSLCPYGVGTCFVELEPREHPLGQGGQRRPLLPFKSVAVDPRFVPLGTTLYVPELRGLLLPDGTSHDGCVRADDTGGNIRRHELDFFVESYDNYKLLEDRLWNDHSATPHIEEPRCDYLRTFDPVVDRRTEATDWAKLHARRPAPPKRHGGGSQGKHVARAKPRGSAKSR
jgi:hypothetical protein